MAACEKLRFATFELDTQTHELFRNGRSVKLPPQALRLLEFLATHPGKLVTREEIRREIWSETTFVDFEKGINKSIGQIRDALSDDAERPRFVETLPRRGYRFVADVGNPENHSTPVPAVDSTHVASVIAPVTEDGGESSKSAAVSGPGAVSKPVRPVRRWLMIAAAVIVVVAIAGLARMGLGWNHGVRPIRSLAVLPLENLSHDPEQEYFADGMTDDLITDLAKISALRVISRSSVMQYKGTRKSAPEIARELGVDAVLEGTVERDRDRVRITAQLIAAAPERHLWAERYEAGLSDVLTVQASVANAVAQAIQIKATERPLLATPRTVNPEAYEAYLKGRYLWQPGGENNLRKSLDYFQLAIQKDPGYAPAWAGVADAYNRLASWGVLPRREAAPLARDAAEKALALDNALVEPLVALASVKMDYEWDWAGAEQLCRRAIQLAPNSAQAHAIYAILLAATGRIQEGVAEMRRARSADPLDSVVAANLAWQLYLARNYEEAERLGDEWNEWHPWERGHGDYIRASIYLQTQRQREAVEELHAAAAETHHQALLELMYLGHALGVTGARDEGWKVLAEMQALSQSRYVPPDYIAMVYEGLGDRDRALEWYKKAVDERSMNIWILPDQRLDQIRIDPRFQDIMRRMGLPN